MDRREYTLRCEPISSLSQSKAAKFQEVMELVDRKIFVDRREIAHLLDLGDIVATRDMETSDIDIVDKTCALILRGEPYPDPDKRLLLDVAYDRARRHYNKARVDGVPEDRVAELNEYLNKIEALIAQMQAEQQAAQAAAQQPPAGAPAPEAPPMEEPPNV
jgi:hypothetical protein